MKKASFRALDDSELLFLLKQGSEAAFTELYDRYWESVADYAIRFTKSEAEGLDILQEIFVSLWRRRETVVVHGAFSAYLLIAVRNLALKYLAKNLQKHDFLAYLAERNESLQHQDLSDDLHVKQLQQHLERTIEKLPPKMRAVYRLSREQQLSHKEIAAKLGIAENTVKKQINYALKIISAALSTHS